MTVEPHIPASDLDGYLRHTLTPRRRQHVRGHLDSCEHCWHRWNRHRWDAAAGSLVYAQLASFLGPRFHRYFDSSRALATEWDTADPRTEQDVAQFFRTSTSYLYNLAIWEGSGNRPAYTELVLPALAARPVRTILDYGCGIGSDTIPLHRNGYEVVGCDFASPSTAFLRYRSAETIPLIEPGDIASIDKPDTLWIIDTLDHLVDIDASLAPVLPAAHLVVTENLMTTVGHGRQQFHIRRPYAEHVSLFAKYGLVPQSHTSSTMLWTRRT